MMHVAVKILGLCDGPDCCHSNLKLSVFSDPCSIFHAFDHAPVADSWAVQAIHIAQMGRTDSSMSSGISKEVALFRGDIYLVSMQTMWTLEQLAASCIACACLQSQTLVSIVSPIGSPVPAAKTAFSPDTLRVAHCLPCFVLESGKWWCHSVVHIWQSTGHCFAILLIQSILPGCSDGSMMADICGPVLLNYGGRHHLCASPVYWPSC